MLAGFARCVWTSRSVRRPGCSTRGDACWTREALARVFFGVVDEAKLDGVDVEFFGEFVEGDLEADAAGGFAGRAHPGAHAEVEVDERWLTESDSLS